MSTEGKTRRGGGGIIRDQGSSDFQFPIHFVYANSRLPLFRQSQGHLESHLPPFFHQGLVPQGNHVNLFLPGILGGLFYPCVL